MSDQHQYLNVLSPGPLMIVRVPLPMPPWRKGILRALTDVMHEHGLRQKDISSIEGLVPIDPSDRSDKDLALIARIEFGLHGDPAMVPSFWLYDWHDGGFKLARRGTS